LSDADPWRLLERELDRWAERRQQATFWLRDDDAVEPTGALDRLLDLTAGKSIPLTLAVIPEKTTDALARRLAQHPLTLVAQHGWSHRNHARAGEKTQELGAHRPAEVVLAELRSGVLHLSRLHGARFVPLLVPPWNRIDPALLHHLDGIGLSALSVFGSEKPGPVLSINTHVDLIDWKGTRGGREPAALVKEIVARMQHVAGTDAAVGILSHHLDHDEPAWTFLAELFERTARHPACRWAAVSAFLGDGGQAR
jgi:hypothetical protein